MKKIILTLTFSLFFIAFTNAQSTTETKKEITEVSINENTKSSEGNATSCSGKDKEVHKEECKGKSKEECKGKAKAECKGKSKEECKGKSKKECKEKSKAECKDKAKAECKGKSK